MNALRNVMFSVAIVASAAALAGCGDPCADLADKMRECCDKGAAEAKETCNKVADAIESDGEDCGDANDAFKCTN